MKVTSYAVARPGSMDRKSTSILSGYDATVGPHGQTSRTSYTVPANRKANLEYVFARVERVTAATVGGTVFSFQKVYNATDAAVILFPSANILAPAAIIYNQVGSGITVYAAENVSSFTSDASTGGTVYFVWSGKFTEFDA